MKLRIKGNSIRYRLSQTEVTEFGRTGTCMDEISFGDQVLKYTLERSEVAEVQASYRLDEIQIRVPKDLADQWVTDETMVGFDRDQELANKNKLYILVEKDFQCLADRPREDETDNFPNPLAGKQEC